MERNKTETKLTLQIPKSFDSEEREQIAREVMGYIYERTLKGHSVYNRKWTGKAGEYSENYARQKGVGKSGPVDLLLNDEMLRAMQYFKSMSKPGQITIGYKSGSRQEGKAEGNILGTYGKDTPIPGKARPFLDILKKDLDILIKKVSSKDEKQTKEQAKPKRQADRFGPEGYNPFALED